MKKTIYYSFRIRKDLAANSSEIKYGLSHYSYKLVKNKFMDAIAQTGILPIEILRPEIYKQPVSFKFLSKWQINTPHIIFKPFEEIRILKNAYNIAVLAWEWDKISNKVGEKCLIPNSPLANQKRMLSLLDEIWVLSSYFDNVLKIEGFKNSHFIPAPIKVNKSNLKKIGKKNIESSSFFHNIPCTICDIRPLISKETAVLSIKDYLDQTHPKLKEKKFYITFLNPTDIRKNFIKVLKTFSTFSKKHPEAILVIKMIINENYPPLKHINLKLSEMLNFKEIIKNKNIIFVSKTFTRDDLEKFISSHDYYYCLSKAEGQNLPLLEAMALGVVPVSVNHTAMEDYISQDNSLIIKSLKDVGYESATTSGDSGFGFYNPKSDSAVKALEESLHLTMSEYKKKSSNAKKAVRKKFSNEVVIKKIQIRFKKISQKTKT